MWTINTINGFEKDQQNDWSQHQATTEIVNNASNDVVETVEKGIDTLESSNLWINGMMMNGNAVQFLKPFKWLEESSLNALKQVQPEIILFVDIPCMEWVVKSLE